MIPILFPANETLFIANGLGRLNDAISCHVTEQRNDEYELEMEYPVTGIHFDLIEEGNIIYAKHSDMADSQPFVIYSISRPLNGVVTINAEHISYRLNKEVVTPFSAPNASSAMSNLTSHAIDCPFTFWSDKTTVANFNLDHPENIRKVLGGMEGSLLDVYGGEYEWDKFTVKLHTNRGVDNNVTLRYGKNLTSLLYDTDTSSIITACVPYWKNGDSVKYITSDPVVKSEYYDDFPYGLTISLDCTQLLGNEDPEYVPTDEQLTNCANNYMVSTNAHLAKKSIKVSFVPLYQTEEYKNIAPLERVNLCDWVTVVYDAFSINVKMKVTETVYDVLLERYESIVLGEYNKTLSKAVNTNVNQQVTQASSGLAISLDAMRAKLLGVKDSFKYEETDEYGNVIATYYMDTDDMSTAQNVIRINSGGIGFSQSGVSGTFTSAWTIEGVFNAQFIQTGTMSADRIQGGTLELGGRNNTNGVLQILDTSGVVIGEWDKDGIDITKGKVNLIASSYNDYTKLSVIFNDNTNPRKAYLSPYDLKFEGRSLGMNWTSSYGERGMSTSVSGLYGIVSPGVLTAHNGTYETTARHNQLVINNPNATTRSQALWVNGAGYATGGFSGGSARALKKNIKEYKENACDKINEIKIVSFNLKEDETKSKKIGFIADDTNELFATAEHNAIDYNNCIGMLLKAVQELSAKVDDLENKK